ncbi:MAG: sulfurtransferase TusA family protein [Deltaproteobacteria bacterium]|nr:sulfurtransferase TusA family protein [Deltaproteobacteria bacterium]
MHVIDLRGVRCPTNFVKAKLALEDLTAGDLVQIFLDGGNPIRNLPRSLKAEGHKLLSLKKTEQQHYVLNLVKGAS